MKVESWGGCGTERLGARVCASMGVSWIAGLV